MDTKRKELTNLQTGRQSKGKCVVFLKSVSPEITDGFPIKAKNGS